MHPTSTEPPDGDGRRGLAAVAPATAQPQHVCHRLPVLFTRPAQQFAAPFGCWLRRTARPCDPARGAKPLQSHWAPQRAKGLRSRCGRCWRLARRCSAPRRARCHCLRRLLLPLPHARCPSPHPSPPVRAGAMTGIAELLDRLLPCFKRLASAQNLAQRTQDRALDLLFAVPQETAAALAPEASELER